MVEVVRRTIADVDIDEDDTFPSPPPAATNHTDTALTEAAATITALGRSPRGGVTVRRIPGDIVEVKLRKGTLQRWSGAEAAYLVPESADPQHAALDPAGQVLAIVALAALSYGLIRLGDTGIDDPLTAAGLLTAVVLFAVFIVVELRHSRPMLPVRLFADRHFTTMNVASAALGFGPYTIYAFLSLFMQQVQDLSAMRTGLAFLPMSIATALVAPVAGRWMGRHGPRAPMLTGYAASAAGLFGLVWIEADTPYPQTAVLYVLIGLGMGFSMTPTTTAAVTAVPRQRSGIASATVNTTRQTGMALGVSLLGAIVSGSADFVTGLHIACVVAGVVSMVAVVMVWFTRVPAVNSR
ncbi:MAG: MFS transporter, partial [Stackebrandtia sp.]